MRTKAERRAAQIAALKKWQPGQSGNPHGQGFDRCAMHREFRRFMSAPSDFSESGEANRYTLWRSMLLSAIQGDSIAAVALLEQDMGKAPMAADEIRLALAAHFQRVAKDSADIILQCMGSRREKMSPEEVSAFISGVAVNVAAYFEKATAAMLHHGDAAIVDPAKAERVPEALQEQPRTFPAERQPGDTEDET